ncbi:MAG: rRNA pseudouridine synthase [Candidatus Pacebacteria bacterium]|nr:rRNA pseudouridine synthase [Candidatus Paceibacterota bacterium]
MSDSSMRIARYLAAAGLASRRKSEDLVTSGRVRINGQKVRDPATNIDTAKDTVTCDGRAVRPQRKHYIVLNKPPGYTCSASDEHAARLITDIFPKHMPRLFTVGRLDRNSEGLIICTNDGTFAQTIAHPRYEITKTYHVLVRGKVTAQALKELTQGIRSDGETLRAKEALRLRKTTAGTLVEIVVAEGKKREIRRMCTHFGWRVLQLVRTRIGPIKLGQLPPGKWRHLSQQERSDLTQ